MKFHEKLNLLMSVQNIPNNKLAKALSVDPSLVSRWRNGSRKLAKHSEYITGIATYFSNQSGSKNTLIEILDIPKSDDMDSALLSDKIWYWLSDELTPDTLLVNQFLARFNQAKESKLPPFIPELLLNAPSGKKLNVEVYYGNDGKRQSAIKFLTSVITNKATCTLKLYSDDSMDWMLEDADFSLKWAHLVAEVIRLGNRIVIIHTINRGADEMNAAIDRWLPLYMTGAIEPYYYLGQQESPFKHTLFLAPEIVALTSRAIVVSEQLLYHDPTMLAALDLEFNAYLEHCRPLMKVFTMKEIDKFQNLIKEFESQKGNMAILSKALPLSTNATFDNQIMIDLFNNRMNALNATLRDNRLYVWLELPELDPLKSKTLSYKGPIDWFFETKPVLKPEHFMQHVAHVLQLMRDHKNFHVRLTPLPFSDDILIAFKQDVGVIVCKIDASPIFMVLNHITLINAFENFIEELSDNTCSDTQIKTNTISALENWLVQAQEILKRL